MRSQSKAQRRTGIRRRMKTLSYQSSQTNDTQPLFRPTSVVARRGLGDDSASSHGRISGIRGDGRRIWRMFKKRALSVSRLEFALDLAI